MLYYRYRPGTEFSTKELIYDEIFFSSAAESNDPYEGKMFAQFGKDEERWDKLIRCALSSYPGIKSFDYIIKKIVDYFLGKSPIYMDEALNTSLSDFLTIADNNLEKIIYSNLLSSIKDYIAQYCPAEQYFASFSHSCDNMLMWSHYANNHRGYCLVFRISEGKLKQNPSRKKTSFSFDTPKSFSPKMSFVLEDYFSMQDIIYVSNPRPVDAFMCFNSAIAGAELTEEQINEHRKELNSVYMKKHTVWEEEKESRIVLSSGIPWLAGERLSLTPYQRLFHYDSSQLVGIVLGAKMPSNQKEEIRRIIVDKVDRWYTPTTGDRIISDFLLFEEKLSEENREVYAEPVEIYNGSRFIKRNEPEFKKRFEDWEAGYVVQFSGSESKRIQIK